MCSEGLVELTVATENRRFSEELTGESSWAAFGVHVFSSSPGFVHFLRCSIVSRCSVQSPFLCILLALAFRDYALDLVESTIGARYLFDDIASNLSSPTTLTSLGCPSFHALLRSRAIRGDACLIRLAFGCILCREWRR